MFMKFFSIYHYRILEKGNIFVLLCNLLFSDLPYAQPYTIKALVVLCSQELLSIKSSYVGEEI